MAPRIREARRTAQGTSATPPDCAGGWPRACDDFAALDPDCYPGEDAGSICSRSTGSHRGTESSRSDPDVAPQGDSVLSRT